MNRDEILALLRTHKPILMERFGVTALALFGSFARDQASDSSDVDILVRLEAGPATSRSLLWRAVLHRRLAGSTGRLGSLMEALRAEIPSLHGAEALDV